jgi:hypothetical protein
MTSVMLVIQHVRDNFAAAFFPRRSEWVAASLLLALGVTMSNNAEMVSFVKPLHGMMPMVALQWMWSWLVVFAVARLSVLLINGAWRRSPHARGITAFVSCFFWAQLTLYFALSPNSLFSSFFILPGAWLVTDMLNILYAFRDARTVDHSYAVRRRTGERQ